MQKIRICCQFLHYCKLVIVAIVNCISKEYMNVNMNEAREWRDETIEAIRRRTEAHTLHFFSYLFILEDMFVYIILFTRKLTFVTKKKRVVAQWINDIINMPGRLLARRCIASAVKLNRLVVSCRNVRLVTAVNVNHRCNVLTLPSCCYASSSSGTRKYPRKKP